MNNRRTERNLRAISPIHPFSFFPWVSCNKSCRKRRHRNIKFLTNDENCSDFKVKNLFNKNNKNIYIQSYIEMNDYCRLRTVYKSFEF